jgi:NADPH-dependent curcumin reductase CurA
MPDTNVKVVLRTRPAGEPHASDFEIVKDTVPSPGPGAVLSRTIYLSLDPYMRGRISGARSYATPVEVGDVIVGGTVGEVLASNDPRLVPGDIVLGAGGWQTHAVASAATLRKLDPREAPISTALGVLGMPGMTAYVGLHDIGRPQAGETVVVSSASGAVGAVVGQLARIRECRVVGIAGSDAKCRYVVDELGFDACLNYRDVDLPGRLRAACPRGIDVYFENVGGAVLDAVMPLLNFRARIPLCGLIAEYNLPEPPRGPNLRPLLVNRALIQGFIVSDHADRMPAFLADMSRFVREGRVKYREDIVEGLERAPEAFIGLLRGKNFGKMLVRVSPDPTR